MTDALALRDLAQTQLMEIKTLETGKEYLSKIKTIETWARAEKKDADLQQIIAEQKIRTQRILGGLIKDGQERGEIASKGNPSGNNQYGNVTGCYISSPKTLEDVGITRRESSVFKAIHDIPEETFEAVIQEKKQAVDKAINELTTSGMLAVAKGIKHEEKMAEIRDPARIPIGLYNLIYADPPWKYDNSGFSMSAEKQYPVMDTEAISRIEIPSSENAVLFMWVTNPLLIPDAQKVIEGWGFQYKTNIVWVKKNHTAGFYVFGQHELLLICTKGTGMTPHGDKFKSVVYGDNDVHSKKPEVFYEMIEAMYPGSKKLEMFARSRREGWESFGNEI